MQQLRSVLCALEYGTQQLCGMPCSQEWGMQQLHDLHVGSRCDETLSLSHTLPFCINRFSDYFTLMSPSVHTSPKPPVGFLSSTNELTVTLCLLAPVDNPEECTLGSEEEKVTSDMVNGPAAARSMLVKCPAPYTTAWSTFPKALCEIPRQNQCADCPVEVLQDLILEDIEDDEIPRDVHEGEWSSSSVHACPVEVLQDLVLEDIEDDEIPHDVDQVLEDIEDDEIPRDVTSVVMDSSDQSVEFLTKRGLMDDVSPVEVLQDHVLEDIEDNEIPCYVHQGEWSSSSSVHACPVEVLQDLVLEDIEDDEIPRDVENGPAAAQFMLVKRPAPYTTAWSTFPKALCPVEVLQDQVLEDIEDDEIPHDVVRCISLSRREMSFSGASGISSEYQF
ncbi:hypothetical protein P7K49_033758 [Saguinus oedipus]|uniref:Uncharacterized protein n=1 Tax=Saguinus oedipus TaxID=9490 RepID=A0ABQ9TSU7_SAGOE|nr:hypothetical protein P7K49_033758 [Saguinus oedipus]